MGAILGFLLAYLMVFGDREEREWATRFTLFLAVVLAVVIVVCILLGKW